jgi:quercetin dioxygenase-like cupin family protein
MAFSIADVQVKHHFGAGIYAKELKLPAAHYAETHSHPHAHLSCLAQGVALVQVAGKEQKYYAPCMIEISAHHKHKITAVTDIVWYCIHATDETDPDKLDAQLTEGE